MPDEFEGVVGYCPTCRMDRPVTGAPVCFWCETDLLFDSDPTEDPKYWSY